MYALVDGNNFYVSCERVFQPALRGRPVVVLSNNDGCAISRSNEARALGIRMGAPWHEIRHLVDRAGLVVRSANFALYGDMSERMMGLLARFGPGQEVYSIDECFVDLRGVPGDLRQRGLAMRALLGQWLGLPCGVGIGPTKTLAKLANHVAKTAEREPGRYPPELAGVCHYAQLSLRAREALLAATDVGEVWGVGPRLRSQLHAAGVGTALALARQDPQGVRQRWSVVLSRTVRELREEPCLGLHGGVEDKQQIACTRSFGQPVTALEDLGQAVTVFATRAAEKLRRQHGVATRVVTYIRTSPFRQTPQHVSARMVPLVHPSDETATLVGAALQALRQAYRPGFAYAKAGVLLQDLQPASLRQAVLDFTSESVPAGLPRRPQGPLDRVVDQLNQRYGQDTVHLASAGLATASRGWTMRQQHRSPRYTTHWDELPVAKA